MVALEVGVSATSPPEQARFLPVHIVESTSATIAATTAVEIALPNGRVVRVPPGFDAATLARVLEIAGTDDERC